MWREFMFPCRRAAYFIYFLRKHFIPIVKLNGFIWRFAVNFLYIVNYHIYLHYQLLSEALHFALSLLFSTTRYAISDQMTFFYKENTLSFEGSHFHPIIFYLNSPSSHLIFFMKTIIRSFLKSLELLVSIFCFCISSPPILINLI